MSRILAWVMDSTRLVGSPRRRGLSRGYVLPSSLAPRQPEELAGARVFIVLRERTGLRLHACLLIDSIEQFIEGASAGDLLLGPDPLDSFLCSWPGGDPGFILPQGALSLDGEGVFSVPEAFEEAARLTVAKSIRIRFAAPDKALLARLGAPPKVSATVSRRAMEAALGTFALEDVWAFGGRPKLSPFANVAFHHIDREGMDEDATLALAVRLNALDPAATFSVGGIGTDQSPPEGPSNSEPAPHTGEVDVDLLPLDPNQIYARVFVAKARKAGQEGHMAEATSRAEARHQEILREVALRLLALGVTPLASRSIDLAVKIADGKTVLFEVKSASIANVASQAAKGIFQLHAYALALGAEGDGVARLGLVQEALGADIDDWITRVAESTGVIHLPYRDGESWPGRLPGLDACIERGCISDDQKST